MLSARFFSQVADNDGFLCGNAEVAFDLTHFPYVSLETVKYLAQDV